MESAGLGELRRELLAGLHGEVVEVGAGNGLNFAHYPTTVTRVVAVEPEPYLRELAARAARLAPVPVTIVPGVADDLPLGAGEVDAAVLCLVMCSLPDRPAALAELRRVVRPGGEVRFLEHTIASTRALRAVQRLVDATLWPLLAGGCHTATDPVGAITGAGFDVQALRRLRFPDARLSMPAKPHVLGTARAPADV
jgi:ubiquinone/menaquinone biosynthesis C-methylase UbiE